MTDRTNEKLTGDWRWRSERVGMFRRREKLILQVYCTAVIWEFMGGGIESRKVAYWRDARSEDMSRLVQLETGMFYPGFVDLREGMTAK